MKTIISYLTVSLLGSLAAAVFTFLLIITATWDFSFDSFEWATLRISIFVGAFITPLFVQIEK